MIPLKIEMYLPEMVSVGDTDELSDQLIEMDDWDYLLVVDADWLESASVPCVQIEYESIYPSFEHEHPTRREITKDGLPWSILNGVCKNEWHVAEFKGKRHGVGIAYH